MSGPAELPNEFFHAVHALRRLPQRYRLMAVYAADWWSEEKLETAEANGDLPGRLGELKPRAAN